MVAGPFVFSWKFVDHTGCRLYFQSLGDKDVIDAHAPVSFETKISVVPPAETFFWLLKQAEAMQIYTYTDFAAHPVEYCGIHITDSPTYKETVKDEL